MSSMPCWKAPSHLTVSETRPTPRQPRRPGVRSDYPSSSATLPPNTHLNRIIHHERTTTKRNRTAFRRICRRVRQEPEPEPGGAGIEGKRLCCLSSRRRRSFPCLRRHHPRYDDAGIPEATSGRIPDGAHVREFARFRHRRSQRSTITPYHPDHHGHQERNRNQAQVHAGRKRRGRSETEN